MHVPLAAVSNIEIETSRPTLPYLCHRKLIFLQKCMDHHCPPPPPPPDYAKVDTIYLDDCLGRINCWMNFARVDFVLLHSGLFCPENGPVPGRRAGYYTYWCQR